VIAAHLPGGESAVRVVTEALAEADVEALEQIIPSCASSPRSASLLRG
jgi:hypothetical protein